MAITATRSDIGRRVVYQRNHKDDPEEGVITDLSVCFAFVRYGADPHSRPTLLTLLDWAPRHVLPSLIQGGPDRLPPDPPSASGAREHEER